MPVHSLFCATCGAERHDVYMPLRTLPEPRYTDGYKVTQDYDRPLCCGQRMDIFVPNVVVDCKEPFQRITFERRQPDGSYRPEVVDSVSKMRRVERETERAAANGEGEAVRFRMWSQSDGHANSFGADPSVQATADLARMRKALPAPSRAKLEKRRGSPHVTLGPGVTESTASVFADR